jgi:hypothetical protein
VLVRGLHPAIAVVAASAVARAAAISAIVGSPGSQVVQAADVNAELERAAARAEEQHQKTVAEKRSLLASAQEAVSDALAVSTAAGRETATASADLEHFDQLARRLTAAEEGYETAVREDAEAARALATALGELDRILGQRHSASTSLEQARKARDSLGVPSAVIAQAMNLQAALAKAEAEKHEAVRHADASSARDRVASRDALAEMEAAHAALREGMTLISTGAPDWGAGVPLPGLVANYRDQLASSLTAKQATEENARSVEAAARARFEQERQDLDALVGEGTPVLDPQETLAAWVESDRFNQDDAVFSDDAFGRFGVDAVAHLLTSLAGRGCQVIYLTDDAEILSWAIGLPHEAGGASTMSALRDRKPALVND